MTDMAVENDLADPDDHSEHSFEINTIFPLISAHPSLKEFYKRLPGPLITD